MLQPRGGIRVGERCATPGTRSRPRERAFLARLTCDNGALVPLAGLEPATCCLGDNCPSSGLYGSVGSSQVTLGDDSGESGLVRFSCGLWNDRGNDHLSKRLPESGAPKLRPGPAGRRLDHRAEVALRESQAARPGASVVGDNVWLATDRLTTLGLKWLCDVDFGHGFWTR
jgi:hypothetical protein